MKKCAAFVWSMLILSTAAFTQPNPITLWAHTYGGNSDDYAFSAQQTADGGYILAGKTLSFGAGDADAYLVKTNSMGDTLWTRAIGGIYHDEAWSVQQTLDGGYIVAVWTDDTSGAGYADFYLVKTNGSGEPLWTRTYGGSSEDRAVSVQQTTDGGYIAAGYTQCFGAGYYDFYLIKTNALGDTLWTRTYGGSEGEFAYSIQQTDDDGFIVAGLTNSFGAGFNDFYLVKTNSSGDTLWTRTYGGTGYEIANSVQQTDDGGYIAAGETKVTSAARSNIFLAKTNGSGDQLWTRTYGENSDDRAWSVQQAEDGGYIVAGMTQSFGANWGDFFLGKMNSQGDSLWMRTYGGTNWDEAYSVQQTADGGYLVAGWSNSFGAGGNKDFYLVKTGPDISSSSDPLVLQPSAYSLCSYPNPFNAATMIAYDLPAVCKVSLRVFDIRGRESAVLKDGFVEAGSHRVMFDGSGLASGIYFMRLDAGGITQTRKLMLLK
ncbi:T9SS C-terminal target domain-containing protein [candidate division KSB1 bacterium]|nr:MAG: T9SS C-terminal target domain-containing protein [candidate division KSB1 bacterium]